MNLADASVPKKRVFRIRCVTILTRVQALTHPYFFALPYPSHPSKLPKCSSPNSARPLEEVDGNITNPTGGKSKLKRKLTSPDDEAKTRSISRRLDFSKHAPGS